MASKTTQAVAAAAAMALAMGCSPTQNAQTTNTVNSATSDEGVDTPQSKYSLNPSPVQEYQVTLTIDGAPGPFKSVEGTTQYDVMNESECGEYLESVGVRPRVTTNEPFTLTRISEVEYRGTVYMDLIQDADYFGNGVCRWELTEVRARLRATGDAKETRFVPDISVESLLAQESKKQYFWAGYYPREEGYDDFPAFGEAEIAHVPPDKRGEFFTITLASEKVRK